MFKRVVSNTYSHRVLTNRYPFRVPWAAVLSSKGVKVLSTTVGEKKEKEMNLESNFT